jgi:hypothetical protein
MLKKTVQKLIFLFNITHASVIKFGTFANGLPLKLVSAGSM